MYILWIKSCQHLPTHVALSGAIDEEEVVFSYFTPTDASGENESSAKYSSGGVLGWCLRANGATHVLLFINIISSTV